MALSNSRKMILANQPIDLSQWKSSLENEGIAADRDAFFSHAKALNLRNTIFIDNTASERVAKEYGQYEFLDACKEMGIIKDL